jgi:hypothetical protein
LNEYFLKASRRYKELGAVEDCKALTFTGVIFKCNLGDCYRMMAFVFYEEVLDNWLFEEDFTFSFRAI